MPTLVFEVPHVSYSSDMTPGGRIRTLRQQRGWTQVQLAEHAAISRRTLMRIEQGLPAQRATIRCVARALEVDEEELVVEPNGDEEAA